MLRVVLLSTGHEVVRGFTPNTNATFLARRLTEAGALVASVTSVGDDLDGLVAAFRAALASADVVVATGGLGPTEDDRTREALAKAVGVPLAHDEAAWGIVLSFFARLGKEPGPVQRRQALLPKGAIPLANREGTAPGVLLTAGAAAVYLLPGPPREMTAMFESEVLPRVASDPRLEPAAARVLWTAGLPESEIAGAIDDLMRASEPTVGTHPDEGEIAVRILARGRDAAARADALSAEIARRLGPAVFSSDEGVRIQHAVVQALARGGKTITTAESVTGGLVARMLVELPGASDVFRGGWVVYSDAWKRDALGVEADLLARHGAVAEPVVRAMAEGARARAKADLAVATTGVAGPGPDARGIAAGTVWVGLAAAEASTRVVRLALGASRLGVQRRAAVLALDLVRRALASG